MTESGDGTPERVPHLGDDARRLVSSDGSGEDRDTRVQLLVRRANVVIEIDHTSQGSSQQATAEVDRLARTTLDRVHID